VLFRSITHAHPDHSFGLKQGTGLPVYVTKESHRLLSHYPVPNFRIIQPDEPFEAGPFHVLPYRVIHSINAPAIGYRVTAGKAAVVYNADLIAIEKKDEILAGAKVYIGDGSTLVRPLVRRKGDLLFGHTTVRAQLNWCKQLGIPRAFIVHCGKQLVEMDPAEVDRKVDELAEGKVDATVACDGMEVTVR
jgi:phosphoribosyl 1,2-cyclic phosphodiesterase